MPERRLVRQYDFGGRAMLNALTGEEGSLQAGALPSVKAASVAGATAIHQALGDEGKLVAKPPKKKKERKNPTVGALNTSWFIIRGFNSFLGFVAPYLMVSNKNANSIPLDMDMFVCLGQCIWVVLQPSHGMTACKPRECRAPYIVQFHGPLTHHIHVAKVQVDGSTSG